MNKRGGSFFFGLTIGIVLFIFGVLLIPFFTDDITTARDSSHLDCSNVSISDGVKFTCLQIDLVIPFFIWFFVSLAVGIIAGMNK
jgi:hypothetical protein